MYLSLHGDTPNCIYELPAPKELVESLPREIIIMFTTRHTITRSFMISLPQQESRQIGHLVNNRDILDKMLRDSV